MHKHAHTHTYKFTMYLIGFAGKVPVHGAGRQGDCSLDYIPQGDNHWLRSGQLPPVHAEVEPRHRADARTVSRHWQAALHDGELMPQHQPWGRGTSFSNHLSNCILKRTPFRRSPATQSNLNTAKRCCTKGRVARFAATYRKLLQASWINCYHYI